MNSHVRGFTLIELIIVIVILGVLSVVAAPRFIDLSRDARIAALEGLAGQMNSTIDLVQAKARVQGLRVQATNPNAGQSNNIIEFPFGSVEVDFRNLCPESEGELGTALDFPDFMELSGDFADTNNQRTSNQYTGIGYDVPSGFPTDAGCYVRYDSFGTPDCTVEVIDDDC